MKTKNKSKSNDRITLEEIITGWTWLVKMTLEGVTGMEDQREVLIAFKKFFDSQNYPQDYFDDTSKTAPANLVDAFKPVAKRIGYLASSIDTLGYYAPTGSFTKRDGRICSKGLKPFYNPFIDNSQELKEGNE